MPGFILQSCIRRKLPVAASVGRTEVICPGQTAMVSQGDCDYKGTAIGALGVYRAIMGFDDGLYYR